MIEILSFAKEAINQKEITIQFLLVFITLGFLFQDFIAVAKVLRTILIAYSILFALSLA